MIRAFLAIDIADDVKKNLERLITTLKPQSEKTVKWVKPQQIHVTLQFFGTIDEAKMGESIARVVEKNIQGIKPVTLECIGIGCFPKWQYAGVIWAGLSEGAHVAHSTPLRGDGASPSRALRALEDLQQHLERDFEAIGFKKENRTFVPHLTLGRVKGSLKNAGWIKTLEAMKDRPFGQTTVDHLTLYKSELTREGAVYSAVRRFDF